MNVIICGSTNIKADSRCKEELIKAVKESGFHITKALSPGRVGPDQLAIWFAEKHRQKKTFLKWFWPRDRPGKIVDEADAVIVLWGGPDADTQAIMEEAARQGKTVHTRDVSHLGKEGSDGLGRSLHFVP